MPAIDASRNNNDVISVANKVNGNNVDDEKQNQKDYSNTIDLEVNYPDVSISGEKCEWWRQR